MTSKQKVGGGIAAAIAIATAIAGGSYAFDFSQDNDTTIIDDHSVTGDTNIYQDFKDELIDQATLAGICLQDVIPAEYEKACEER